MQLHYQLLNVFTRGDAPFTGNPLCVFEDGRGLDTETMQALARQFNLSETTFLLPSTTASAHVRIFTPDFEMAFAGHPTLGSAHVVRARGCNDQPVTLEMPAGIIPVASSGQRWVLTSRHDGHREADLSREALAAALGLLVDDVCWQAAGARPLWLDNGTEQLIVPLNSPAAVRRAAPRMAHFEQCVSRQGRRMAYVFAATDAGQIEARFFFEADGVFREDPATGSACANLGGWYLATGAAVPLARRVSQGEQVHRPSCLYLAVDAQRNIRVGGDVVALGRGTMDY